MVDEFKWIHNNVFDIFVIFKVFLMTFYRSSSLQMPLETFSL